MINVAILGYGTVGSGVFEVLNENKESISRRAGQELHVKYVLDLRDFPGQPVEKVLVHDYEQIVSDPEVDIVVEAVSYTHLSAVDVRIRPDSFISVEKIPISVSGEFITTERAVMIL